MKTIQERRITLRDLFSHCEGIEEIEPEFHDIEITGITQDSRKVEQGFLFVALRGNKEDGIMYIPHAVANGAVAILGDEELLDAFTVPVVHSENPRLTLSHIAAHFYASQPSHNVAVTGTNGKTSIVHFCHQIWQKIGHKSACVGTTGITDYEGKFVYDRDNFLTTPDPVKLHDILAQLADKGVSHLAMEASSHGLDQYRLDGVEVEAAAFTNITRDHLDYHGSFEAYFDAKMRLFNSLLPEKKVAVLNADSDAFEKVKAVCESRHQKVLSYGFKGKDIEFVSIEPQEHATQVTWKLFGKKHTIELSLIGEFQVYNLAAAIGLVVAHDQSIEKVLPVLSEIKAVQGRMQPVAQGVYVDYAHTPDALAHALKVLRSYTKGKLWVVFGCGGDRDAGKRALMGEVAQKEADEIVVTDDNPRHEDPKKIRKAILKACPKAKELGDRREAIAYALSQKKPGDTVLVAGKGHEQMQIIGDEHLPFSDVAVIEEELG